MSETGRDLADHAGAVLSLGSEEVSLDSFGGQVLEQLGVGIFKLTSTPKGRQTPRIWSTITAGSLPSGIGRHDDRGEAPLHDGLADFLNVATELGRVNDVHRVQDPDAVPAAMSVMM